ncbi:uncharacterized protein DNG_09242 [Cephalotrichum gorgonifer]|uniref:Heterokaryon incompatibility domain-containing protein n=1 Tax=Cephalotrichum gorgonifer TaxID=2041049 RepID=A0AAE8N7Y3_9PEZI|nr:uncharacterized protein DNG_09242 [Cephalotrichum gorgonifer]
MFPAFELPTFEHLGPWEFFQLLLLLAAAVFVIGALSSVPMTVPIYLASFVVITIEFYRNPPEKLPTPIFWIVLVACLPFIWEEGNAASVILYGLSISHLSLFPTALPILFPIVFIAVCCLVGLAIAVGLTISQDLSTTTLLWWFAMAILMFKDIHLNMPWGYWVGWPFLTSGLAGIFPPAMPIIWNVVASSLVALLFWLVDPTSGVGHFGLFTLSLYSLIFLRALFVFVYVYPETYFFPFNLLSHRYKVPAPAWLPISTLDDPPNLLCAQCGSFTSSSKLIIGAVFRPLVPLVEWHKVSVCQSALGGISPCDLCPLIWSSVDSELLRESFDGEWRIRVWQERPISRYVFAKLYLGDKPVGVRLLVHRRKNFNDPAVSIEGRSTESPRHIDLAKSWLADCKRHHDACNGIGNTPRRPPTRLIHVENSIQDFQQTDGSPSTPRIQLVLTDPNSGPIEYLALSHCWGGTGTFRLLKSNYESCQESIDFATLSKNTRDAVIATRNLGYTHIWIDSLCIIQDSAEDWRAEAARMEAVYAGAVCTLASTASSSGEGGCFHERPGRGLRPCKIGVSSPHPGSEREWIYVRRDDLSDFRRGVDRAPLNKRGWVLQERLLSRRILHFGADMLYWECSLRSASELCPAGFVYKKHPLEYYGHFLPPPIQVEPDGSDLAPQTRWKREVLVSRRTPQPDMDLDLETASSGGGGGSGIWQNSETFMREVRRHSHEPWSSDSREGRYRTALDQIQNHDFENDGILSFSQSWYKIVESYTQSSLSFSTDRFIAIQSIVQEVERVTKYQYVAGLWREHLVECLLWFVTQGPGERLLETTAAMKSQVVVANAETSTGQEQPEEPGDTAIVSLDTSSQHQVAGPNERESSAEIEQTSPTPTEHQPLWGPLTPQSHSEKQPSMAPTWSWVSISAPVSINQFPVNAKRRVHPTRLATWCRATVSPVVPTQANPDSNAVEGVLEIEAPLSKITRLECTDDKWYIYVGSWVRRRCARLIPDLASFAGEVAEGTEMEGTTSTELFAISLLALRRETEMVFHIKTKEVQGIVVRRVQVREGMPDLFERVGFFNTGLVEGGWWHLGSLKKAPLEKVHII